MVHQVIVCELCLINGEYGIRVLEKEEPGFRKACEIACEVARGEGDWKLYLDGF